ncbi:hypothetical protein Q75_02835 [Bacillus coahuilensis p1.1.43]|uniref:Uncharacterized protein n=1 Tax=Bacillus coahuilensis p1.1.43 TaxID=1150625 RepID=A0A147KBD0_9BACI|nr:hypothetical protein [Bacillus coahuilensis]KUP08449.1 hypothetical protein Q75_02835 [Bacillus coahuilensis p1.1.43]
MYNIKDNENEFIDSNSNIKELYFLGLINTLHQEGILVSISLLSELTGEVVERIKKLLTNCFNKGFLIRKSINELMVNVPGILSAVTNQNEILKFGTSIQTDSQNLFLTRSVPELLGINDYGILYYTHLLNTLQIQFDIDNLKIGTVTITIPRFASFEVVDYA